MVLYLIRYSEIALKGKNRKDFERRLIENTRQVVNSKGLKTKITKSHGRIFVRVDQEIDLRRVFGISSYSSCVELPVNLERIAFEALKTAKTHPKTTTFRVTSRRVTKGMDLSSLEINQKIGAFIVEKTGFNVALKNPDLDIGIEIIDDKAFVFDKTVSCLGGLPVGIEGKILCLLTDENSFLAGLLVMRRGCGIDVASLLPQKTSFLQAFSPRKLVLNPITDLSDLDALALKLKCKALVVPDTLNSINDYPVSIPVLRPVIAFSNQEIKSELEKYKSAL